MLWRMLLILSAVIALSSAGAEAIEVSASVDKQVVAPDNRLILTVTLSGARGDSMPVLPPLDGFNVSGPSYSTHIRVINGRSSMSTSYEYVLVPRETGKLTIGPIEVTCQGRSYSTKPITVEVSTSGAPGRGRREIAGGERAEEIRRSVSGKGMFIELTADKSEVYLHEQVVIRFRFYYSGVRLAEQAAYEAPPAPGFIQRQLESRESRGYSQVIDGRQYLVSELRTALFPYQTGELSVGPAKLKGAVLVESRQQQRQFGNIFDDFFNDPFFGHFSKKPFELVSNKVKIKVKPLPEKGAPPGEVSVGRYKLQVEAKPRDVHVGDPITVTMRVSGEGDLETVAPPRVSDLEGFKSYEVTSSTEITERVSRIKGVKTFEQAIVPLNDLIYEIPLIEFSYFNPEKGRYVTLKKGPIPIKIAPAEGEGTSKIISLPAGIAKKDVTLLERNIVFIKTTPGSFLKGRVISAVSPIFWIIQIIPLIVLIVAVMHNRHRMRLLYDRGYARSWTAGKMTKMRMRSVERALNKGTAEGFYGELIKTVNGYISDRLNIPAGGLTPDLVRERLGERGASGDVLKRLDEFYSVCDLARFASAEADRAQMEKAYGEGEAIIAALRASKF